MEGEMHSFFPGGLRVMLVADDTKAVRTATAMLSLLHYLVVMTHSTASTGLRALSRNNVIDVQAILCDVHKVVSSGFDFRRVVETEFRIPVIYLFSTEQMVAGEDVGFLNYLLQTATYIVRKPLDPDVMCQLWRVVAWSKCCPGERRPSEVMDMHAPDGDDSEDDNEDGVVIKEPQVHFKAVRSSGNRKRQLIINVDSINCGSSSGGADGHRTKILEHMNVKGRLGRQHVASHLQRYREKQQKKDLDEHRLPSSDHHSVFLKAILPALNVPPRNPLILAGGTGPSSVANAAFAGNSVINLDNNSAPVAVQATASNAVISMINNAAAPAAVQAPAMEKEQMSSGGVEPDAQQQKLFLGPFSYQGPSPPAMQGQINMLPAMEKGKAPMIELPFGQPVDDLLAGESAYGGAGETTESASEENGAAAVEAEAPNAEPCMVVSDQVAADADPVAAEGDIMFSLESLLGLDDDMLLPLEVAAAAGDADGGSLNGEEGSMEIGWDLDRLEDILMDNTNNSRPWITWQGRSSQ